MLVIASLLALQLGATTEPETDAFGCFKNEVELPEIGDTVRLCASENPVADWPPNQKWLCLPATREFPWCVAHQTGSDFNPRVCFKTDGNYECEAKKIFKLEALSFSDTVHVSDDKTTAWVDCAEEPGFSAGATAGIVVAGILGPFALGLAYTSLT